MCPTFLPSQPPLPPIPNILYIIKGVPAWLLSVHTPLKTRFLRTSIYINASKPTKTEPRGKKSSLPSRGGYVGLERSHTCRPIEGSPSDIWDGKKNTGTGFFNRVTQELNASPHPWQILECHHNIWLCWVILPEEDNE